MTRCLVAPILPIRASIRGRRPPLATGDVGAAGVTPSPCSRFSGRRPRGRRGAAGPWHPALHFRGLATRSPPQPQGSCPQPLTPASSGSWPAAVPEPRRGGVGSRMLPRGLPRARQVMGSTPVVTGRRGLPALASAVVVGRGGGGQTLPCHGQAPRLSGAPGPLPVTPHGPPFDGAASAGPGCGSCRAVGCPPHTAARAALSPERSRHKSAHNLQRLPSQSKRSPFP